MAESRKLPVRYWRWMWLGEAIHVVSIVLVLVLALVYFPARWLVSAIDRASGRVYGFRMDLYRIDERSSGWKPPPEPRAPVVELSAAWRARLPGKDTDS